MVPRGFLQDATFKEVFSKSATYAGLSEIFILTPNRGSPKGREAKVAVASPLKREKIESFVAVTLNLIPKSLKTHQ